MIFGKDYEFRLQAVERKVGLRGIAPHMLRVWLQEAFKSHPNEVKWVLMGHDAYDAYEDFCSPAYKLAAPLLFWNVPVILCSGLRSEAIILLGNDRVLTQVWIEKTP